jgi:hypothetical protein
VYAHRLSDMMPLVQFWGPCTPPGGDEDVCRTSPPSSNFLRNLAASPRPLPSPFPPSVLCSHLGLEAGRGEGVGVMVVILYALGRHRREMVHRSPTGVCSALLSHEPGARPGQAR